jgi:hypothetical protein
MTLQMLTLAALVVIVFMLWLAVRVFNRERPALYVLIPILLAFAIGSGWAVRSMLGYATTDISELREEFFYIHHLGDDPVWLLAVPAGATEPRLYAIPADMLSPKERQGLAETGEKSNKGVPMVGRLTEGEMRLYQFDAPILAPKEG